MDCWSVWLLLTSLFGALLLTDGVELTFELADNAKECFYQEIEKNISSTLEFQVYNTITYQFPITLRILITRHDDTSLLSLVASETGARGAVCYIYLFV